ncbi:MAG: LysR family transcriptional regulator, partial [Leptothrix sp. (in: b-proteobacteria)]
LNYDHQRVQAAQAGQGVVLARLPLVTEMLARGELVEPFGAAGRDQVPYGYWLILASGSARRAEVLRLRDWVAAQAAAVSQVIDPAQTRA